MTKKDYLGDSVYVEKYPDGTLFLTTDNGFGPNNTVILEPQVLDALLGFIGRNYGLEFRRLHRSGEEAEERQPPPPGGKIHIDHGEGFF